MIPDSKYRNYLVPPPLRDKFEVALSIELMDIQDITEVDKTFEAPFTLYLSWIDKRLKYKNLKDNTVLNLLSKEEKSKIWSPKVVFQNTNKKDKTEVDRNTYIQIKKGKEAEYVYTTEWEAEEAKLYEGEENQITIQRYYREVFTCK